MALVLDNVFDCIVSIDNLLDAWQEFQRGKRSRADVQAFGRHLMANLLVLHGELTDRTYAHGGYDAFKVNDPKPRDIHKASVRDRLVHHAIYRQLYPFFDRTFISDSYSCRFGKGTHKAIGRFQDFARSVSRNDTRTCYVLKCDVRKFFASIDHRILLDLLKERIADTHVLRLLGRVLDSFSSTAPGKGLPLGNLTSQLLVNIYMNEFDHFAKRELTARHYIRYADDFVFLSEDRDWLESLIPRVQAFLGLELVLELHPDKVYIQTLASGVDFLGWVHFPHHRVLRTASKRRMLRKLENTNEIDDLGKAVRASYRGMLSYGNTYKLRKAAGLG